MIPQRQTPRIKRLSKVHGTGSSGIVTRILDYLYASNLHQRFCEEAVIRFFDEERLKALEQYFRKKPALTKEELLRIAAPMISNDSNHTLMICITFLDILQSILSTKSSKAQQITFADFTGYICEAIAKDASSVCVPLLKIPNSQNFQGTPPIIVTTVEEDKPLISRAANKIDRKIDAQRPLYQFQCNRTKRNVVTLARLSCTLHIYDYHLKLLQTLSPSVNGTTDKKPAILSMAFSHRQQRIGCILSDSTAIFWEYADNFKAEKQIFGFKGMYIGFAEHNNEWYSYSQTGIYFWNLRDQFIKFTLTQPKLSHVSCITEIPYLDGFCASFSFKDGSRYLYLYRSGNNTRLSRFRLDEAGCHTIVCCKFTQTMIVLGYKDNVTVYTAESTSSDLTLVATLVGHQSIVMAGAQIEGTSNILTGDDKGIIRLWSLSEMRCLQQLCLANTVNYLSCHGNRIFFSDTRLNSLKLEQFSPVGSQHEVRWIYHFCLAQSRKLYMFSNKNCRWVSLHNGHCSKIFELCESDEEISAVAGSTMMILVGTIKGDLMSFGTNMIRRWKINVYDSEITFIYLYAETRLILTANLYQDLYIYSDITVHDGPRKILTRKQNGRRQQSPLSLLNVCYRLAFLAVNIHNSNTIVFFDYQSLRLCGTLQLASQPCAFGICTSYDLLVVACQDQSILFFKLARKELEISTQLLASIKPTSNIFSLQEGPCTAVKFSVTDDRHYVILPYGRNRMCACDYTSLAQSQFALIPTEYKSMSIARPAKEPMIEGQRLNPLKSRPDTISLPLQHLSISTSEMPRIMWDKSVSRDLIIYCSTLEENYATISTVDGQFLAISLADGSICCRMSINSLRPALWNIKTEFRYELERKIFNTLVAIKSLEKLQPALSDKQIRFFDVSCFLEAAAEKGYSLPPPNQIRRQSREIPRLPARSSTNSVDLDTLKNLERYKRIKRDQVQSTGPNQTLSPIQESQSAAKLANAKYNEAKRLYSLSLGQNSLQKKWQFSEPVTLTKNDFSNLNGHSIQEKPQSPDNRKATSLPKASFYQKPSKNTPLMDINVPALMKAISSGQIKKKIYMRRKIL